MERMGKLIGVAVLVVALGGCAAVTASAVGDDAYLTKVKGVWYGPTPSDADLIAYGEEACTQLADGANAFTLAVLPGASGAKVSARSTETDKNNWHAVGFATALCPEVVSVSSVPDA